jgi:hypothetical protein
VKATEAIPIKLSIPIQTLHVQATRLDRKRLLRAEGLARGEDRPVSEVCAAIDELIPLLARAVQESVYLFFVVVAAVEEPAPVGIAERMANVASSFSRMTISRCAATETIRRQPKP